MPVKPLDLAVSTVLGELQSQYLCILYTYKYHLNWSVYESGGCSFKDYVAHNLAWIKQHRIDISQPHSPSFQWDTVGVSGPDSLQGKKFKQSRAELKHVTVNETFEILRRKVLQG